MTKLEIGRGCDRGIPTHEHAAEHVAEPGCPLESFRGDPQTVVGDPGQVRSALFRLAQHSGVEELRAATATHSFDEPPAGVMELGERR